MAVAGSKLTQLQEVVLRHLAPMEPHWTLVGGGSLAAVHLMHRATRDLDLFWRCRSELGGLADEAERRLAEEGLEVEVLQRSVSFARLRVAEGSEVVTVDLVADPMPAVEADEEVELGGFKFFTSSRREILVAKLCALLGRSEIRDLQDVKALLDAGEDLGQALRDAPQVDRGFSPLNLAWVLRDLRVERLASVSGLTDDEARRLTDFRDDLVQQLLDVTRPE